MIHSRHLKVLRIQKDRVIAGPAFRGFLKENHYLFFLGMNNDRPATDILVEKHGRDTKVACIGPAGENMVFCAAIANDKFHYLARCGVGAVMGSKKLKAISINGSHDMKVADSKAFLKKCEECYRKITADKTYPDFSYYGTSVITDIAAESGGSRS